VGETKFAPQPAGPGAAIVCHGDDSHDVAGVPFEAAQQNREPGPAANGNDARPLVPPSLLVDRLGERYAAGLKKGSEGHLAQLVDGDGNGGRAHKPGHGNALPRREELKRHQAIGFTGQDSFPMEHNDDKDDRQPCQSYTECEQRQPAFDSHARDQPL
jgi:hypothetical protein